MTVYLHLKFQDRTTQLTCGDARIVCGGVEITSDCGTIGELEHRVRELKSDLDDILKQARREFARCQGE